MLTVVFMFAVIVIAIAVLPAALAVVIRVLPALLLAAVVLLIVVGLVVSHYARDTAMAPIRSTVNVSSRLTKDQWACVDIGASMSGRTRGDVFAAIRAANPGREISDEEAAQAYL